MRRLLFAVAATAPALLLGACAGGYGYGYGADIYAGGPYSYDGYYDNYYGPIYDGYWGADNYFYYRNSANDRSFRRADRTHFSRSGNGQRFHSTQGSFTPSRGMTMPHFNGGSRGGHRRGH